ncbi:LysR family transcriptional regulator [Stutzerimonas stutzeri B1SMN1]|nr:LysR family transcriptional regulator [Stutzerimonas stutzeri B1SMN1]
MRHQLLLRYVDVIARVGSIRKAAESLAITSTALNRRILALEEDLGVPIFERLPGGVRLSAAGEVLIQHVRSQLADMERVKSQIADLRGERRGHVSIAASQALMPFFLPEQIAHYRRAHQAVTFSVLRRDRSAAEQAITDMSADLALVFEPERLIDLQVLHQVRQPVHVMMRFGHPLSAQAVVRLRDCLRYPLALPNDHTGIRFLLERAIQYSSLTLRPVVEADSFEFLRCHALEENIVAFQFPIGLPVSSNDDTLVTRPIDSRDVPHGNLYLGQLRGRTLPVAVARFGQQLIETLVSRYDVDN